MVSSRSKRSNLVRPDYREVREDGTKVDKSQESSLPPAKKQERTVDSRENDGPKAKSRTNETSTVLSNQQPPKPNTNAKGKGKAVDDEAPEQRPPRRLVSGLSLKRKFREDSSEDDEEAEAPQTVPKKPLSVKAQGKQRAVLSDSEVESDVAVDSGSESESEGSQDEAEELIDDLDLVEYNPSPDHSAGDDNQTGEFDESALFVPLSYVIPDEDLEADEVIASFSDLVRRTFVEFKDEAKGYSKMVFTAEGDDRMFAKSIWGMLVNMNIENHVQLFCASTPRDVQERIVQKDWSQRRYWLSLYGRPSQFLRDVMANYANFPTGDVDSEEGLDNYAGSSYQAKERESQHTTIARRYTPEDLPERYQTRHYITISRAGVQSNFRVLNVFPDPIEVGWLVIYEGVWQLWLHSIQGYTTFKHIRTRANMALYQRIRAKLDLPDVPWKGLNGCWTLMQGFKNPGVAMKSTCLNPACGCMSEPGTGRGLFNPTNPLAGYVCYLCARFRVLNRVLPNAEQVALGRHLSAKNLDTRALRADNADPACAHCGMVESQYRSAATSHTSHEGRLICQPCGQFYRLKSRLRNPAELATVRRELWKQMATEMGWELECDHCGTRSSATYGTTGVLGDESMYCKTCLKHIRKGGLRPVNRELKRERERRLTSDPINKAATAALIQQGHRPSCVYTACPRASRGITVNETTYVSAGVMHGPCAGEWRRANGINYGT